MILKAEKRTFINKYGKKEWYYKKTLESWLSGHLNKGSIFYSYDECGNCDGANCHRCETIYEVIVVDILYDEELGCYDEKVKSHKYFNSYNEAITFYKNN